MSASYVQPRDVDALKRRLGGAFDALAALDPKVALGSLGPDASERSRLVRDWYAFEASAVDWLDAPVELERGRDLEARLSWLQGPRRHEGRDNTGPHAVGETLGMHTVDELRDLLAAKQKERDEVTKAGAAATPSWSATDPAAYAAWAADLARANTAFEVARSGAQGIVDWLPGEAPESGGPLSIFSVPGVDAWDNLVLASKPYKDLTLRLVAAGHAPAPYRVPQPTAADRDLGAYKMADEAAKGIENVGRGAGGIVVAVAAVVGVALFVRFVRK